MEVRVYSQLPPEAVRIREEVFMQEQGFEQEFDEIDSRAVHLVVFDQGRPVATSRFFQNPGDSFWQIGRVAVVRSCRGMHLGKLVMEAAHREIASRGGREIRVSGQIQAAGFYESLGYRRFGAEYLDEGCPHIGLRKSLCEEDSGKDTCHTESCGP